MVRIADVSGSRGVPPPPGDPFSQFRSDLNKYLNDPSPANLAKLKTDFSNLLNNPNLSAKNRAILNNLKGAVSNYANIQLQIDEIKEELQNPNLNRQQKLALIHKEQVLENENGQNHINISEIAMGLKWP